MGLIEILLVSSLGLVISYGVFKTNTVAIQTAKIFNSNFEQQDLRNTIVKALGDDNNTCLNNLQKTAGNDVFKSPIEFLNNRAGLTVIDSRTTTSKPDQNLFKPNLRIKGLKVDADKKDFIVYYTKEGLGRFETLPQANGEPGVCNPGGNKIGGCHKVTCKVNIACSGGNCTCSLLDGCSTSNLIGVSGGANCYTVVAGETKRTLVGCGGASDSGGTKTTALGFSAGKVNTGSMNTFLGAVAGYKNTTAERNTFVGEAAGYNSTGEKNTFLGVATGYNNTGEKNTFLGTWAGHKNTAGYHNVFVGESAGFTNTTGLYNTFVGLGAGFKNTSADSNTFIGRFAGKENTTGEKNTFIGETAGLLNTTGKLNTFVGLRAGSVHTTGEGNTFLGTQAGRQATTGDNNTFIGYQSGWSHTSGSNNIAIGHNARLDSNTGSNQINIGKMIKAGSGYIKICDVNGNNCLKIKGKEKTVSGKRIGVLQICNASGGECIILSKESLKCPENQFFRGFNNAGNAICQSIQGRPQTLGNNNNIRFASMDCGVGKYLRGITSGGKAICANLPRGVHVQTCPNNGYVIGFYENGRIKCSPLRPKGDKRRCATYEHVRGFNNDGSLACVNPWANKTWCEGRQVLTGFDARGNKVCARPRPIYSTPTPTPTPTPRDGPGGGQNRPGDRL